MLIKLYNKDMKGNLPTKLSVKNEDAIVCTSGNIIKKYTQEDYVSYSANNKFDKRPEVIKLNKFRLNTMLKCGAEFSAMGYMILGMQGQIQMSQIPKEKLDEIRNKYK